jgi:hypothetical protein
LLCGLAWRSECPKILRIYFSIFALTIPLFIFSPSMLMNFLLTMNYSSTNGPTFPLYGNYFIEEQNSGGQDGTSIKYKVILKKGIFHQTIQRDISFEKKLDSIRVLEVNPGMNISLRGYTSTKTHVSSEIDSMDVVVPLFNDKPGSVQYQL